MACCAITVGCSAWLLSCCLDPLLLHEQSEAVAWHQLLCVIHPTLSLHRMPDSMCLSGRVLQHDTFLLCIFSPAQSVALTNVCGVCRTYDSFNLRRPLTEDDEQVLKQVAGFYSPDPLTDFPLEANCLSAYQWTKFGTWFIRYDYNLKYILQFVSSKIRSGGVGTCWVFPCAEPYTLTCSPSP